MLRIAEGATVLFQGDSITDADRARFYPDDLGRGYALMAAGWFGARAPERGVRFLNRGIGGDRAVDLLARWDDDCLALRPDLQPAVLDLGILYFQSGQYDQAQEWLQRAPRVEQAVVTSSPTITDSGSSA